MHRTCTNNPVQSDRSNWLIQFEVCFLRSCSEEGSDATELKKRPDCDNSAEIETGLNDMPVLGLAGRH